MEPLWAKVVSLVLLFLLCISCGLLPIKVGKTLNVWGTPGAPRGKGKVALSKKATCAISLLLCFGGGILLGTALVHMLPEVNEGFREFNRVAEYELPSLPFAETLLVAGLFSVYLVEELIHAFVDRRRERKKEKKRLEKAENGTAVSLADVYGKRTWNRQSLESVYTGPNGCYNAGKSNGGLDLYYPSQQNLIQPSVFTCHVDPMTSWSQSTTSLPMERPETASEPKHHHHEDFAEGMEELQADNLTETLSNLLVIVALSFHAVFEGMAIGLETTTTDVWYLFLGVGAHKFVIAFCVGLEIVSAGSKVALLVIYMTVFSLMSPLGIGVGILIVEFLSAGTAAQVLALAVLQALAAGTLLYVTFFEILGREKGRREKDSRLSTRFAFYQIFFMALGFGVMLTLEVFTGHSHGEEGGHDHAGHEH